MELNVEQETLRELSARKQVYPSFMSFARSSIRDDGLLYNIHNHLQILSIYANIYRKIFFFIKNGICALMIDIDLCR